MLILSIDTTGFTASFALVKDGIRVLLNKNSSGFIPFKRWDEFPYLLPDCHRKFLLKNIELTLKKKDIKWKDIDAIAVSANSGIYSCILAGKTIAYTLAKIYNKPLIEVDHILAHNYSSWLATKPEKFSFPVLVFSASGSHSDFALLKNIKSFQSFSNEIEKANWGGVETFIGVGKIFRIAGKSLGLIKPQDKTPDVSIKRLIKAMDSGNSSFFDFTTFYKGKLFDLNFSSLLSVLDELLIKEKKKKGRLSKSFINNMAASFQESINNILSDKIIKLAKTKKVKEIHVCGGLSENKHLKKKLKKKIEGEILLRYPIKKEYRLDNAAMIGCLAFYQQKYNIKFKNFKPSITK